MMDLEDIIHMREGGANYDNEDDNGYDDNK